MTRIYFNKFIPVSNNNHHVQDNKRVDYSSNWPRMWEAWVCVCGRVRVQGLEGDASAKQMWGLYVSGMEFESIIYQKHRKYLDLDWIFLVIFPNGLCNEWLPIYAEWKFLLHYLYKFLNCCNFYLKEKSQNSLMLRDFMVRF